MRIQRWFRQLQYWRHRNERERLLREEMEAHLEMMVQDSIADGVSEPDARRAARRQFGNLTLQQETSRGVWIARWWNDLAQDLTFALRAIRKAPGFAAIAILSAGLGIGACSLVFGIANFALFRQLPVEEPSRLVSVSGRNLRSGKVGQSLTYPDFEDLKQSRSFQGMTGYFAFMPATIAAGGEPQRFWGSVVTANYFDVVRPQFLLGRGFDPAKDDKEGETPVVVLSHGIWRSLFAGDRTVVGRDIELNRRKVTVVGVTAPGFRGADSMIFSDFWLPFSMLPALKELGMGGDRLHDRGSQWMQTAARLRPGVDPDEAAAELEVTARRLSTAYPATNKDRAFHMERAGMLHPGLRKMVVTFFLMLLVVALLVLCTACANVANLLLARASARHKEIAIRLAIGAGRGRLVRQLLTESALLALLSGGAGYFLAQLGVEAIGSSRLPISLPVDLSISLDYRVLLFCVALSACTGIVFGLVPALRATRPSLTGALKGEETPIGQLRRFGLRNLLVVTQVAICMVLLICSGLFLRSLDSAAGTDIGVAHRNLLLLAFDPGLNGYSARDAERTLATIAHEAGAISGVESLSISDTVPLNMEGTQNGFVPEDAPGSREQNRVQADIYSITPRYFETLGIRMIDGEDFRPGVPAEDIVIVNQAVADKAFAKQNPIGRRISYQGRTVRIVGLVETTKSRTIGEEPHPSLYFPLAREIRGNQSLTGMTLILRTQGDPAAYVRQVRETFRRIDPALAVFDVRTMDAQISRALYLPRITALLFGLTGMMGLLIATIGLYGVIAFAVARRTREIGVRIALGATRSQVLGMVLRQGLALTLAGSAIGLGIALVLSRVAASLLYGVSPTDPLTFLTVPAFLVLIALAACLVPGRRAASLDPVRALHYD
jgi:predicted permease